MKGRQRELTPGAVELEKSTAAEGTQSAVLTCSTFDQHRTEEEK